MLAHVYFIRCADDFILLQLYIYLDISCRFTILLISLDITRLPSGYHWNIIRLPSGYHSANLRISLDITRLTSGYHWISLGYPLDMTGYHWISLYFWISLDINDLVSFISRKWLSNDAAYKFVNLYFVSCSIILEYESLLFIF